MDHKTTFASLDRFEKGGVEIIDDDVKHYAFSNVFEVASKALPYEKVVVAKNMQYVLEAVRAEGSSNWFAASHDEFVILLDGELEIDFVALENAQDIVPPASAGTIAIAGEPQGARMGMVRLQHGHQALLPANSAYRFRATHPGVLLIQTVAGSLSVEKWRDICLH